MSKRCSHFKPKFYSHDLCRISGHVTAKSLLNLLYLARPSGISSLQRDHKQPGEKVLFPQVLCLPSQVTATPVGHPSQVLGPGRVRHLTCSPSMASGQAWIGYLRVLTQLTPCSRPGQIKPDCQTGPGMSHPSLPPVPGTSCQASGHLTTAETPSNAQARQNSVKSSEQGSRLNVDRLHNILTWLTPHSRPGQLLLD